ncbi:MAG TPA: hypothetical protein VK498_07970 [Ferruginibacter sp.]|nr:hypothetical protein [Ferruginibacter sp.]
MTQVFNLKSNFWNNVKTSLKAALVVLPILGFVFIMYLDLTHNQVPVKKNAEKQQQEEVLTSNKIEARI